MRLDELYRTGYARRAVDGRRDVERCTTARLGRNVRISQILATYGGVIVKATCFAKDRSAPECGGAVRVVGPCHCTRAKALRIKQFR